MVQILRRLVLPYIMLVVALQLHAQAPQQMNYQAVVRDGSGQPLAAGTNVTLRFQIHNGSPSGTIVYTETANVTTNQFGLVTYAIGFNGNLASVNWGNGAKYLQVLLDASGGGNFTDMGTTQMLSVPYALFSGNSLSGGPTGATGSQGPAGPNGVTGPTGINGAIGATGAQGLRGATGAQGVQGLQGVTGAQGVQGIQGITGAQGVQGIQGIQGIQGVTGVQGIQGAAGVTGARGIQGVQGVQGITGAQGTQGIQGVTGIDGQQGVQGATGVQGLQGIQGVQGNTGAQGLQGIQGVTGNDGQQGIQGVTGATGDQGLQGIQGATGAQGNQGIQGATGNDGQQGIPGAAGATGAQGIQGIQGATGAQGDQGIQGVTGVDGQQGVQGVTGAQGIQGIQGITGNDGPQGIQGAAGVTGVQGVQGIQGIQGVTGAQGIQGIQGVTGNDGPQGIPGAAGVTGAQGVQGIQGIQGVTGARGIQGIQGVTGNDGPQGIQGPAGVTGVQGIQGTPGTPGNDGQQGATGAAGPQGIQGIQGVTGPQGIQGIQGITGNDGQQGIQGATGVAGPTGNDGPQGPQGIAGTNGNDGAQGIPGITGPTGNDGAQGIQGIQGVSGPTGNDGAQGATGASGPQGNDGQPGDTGPTGDPGNDGAQGATGVTGPSGFDGAQGAQGVTGPPGDPGSPGATGPSGATGLIAPGTAAGNTTYWNGVQWITNSSNIYNDGAKVGINTTTPGAQLEVNGTSKFDQSVGIGTVSPFYQFNIDNGTGMHVAGPAGPGSGETSGSYGPYGSFSIDSPGTAGGRFTVQEGGNVGVGTNSPTARLDVAGTVRFNNLNNGVLQVDNNGNVSVANGGNNAFIVNGTSQQANSNFNISGNGTLGGTLTADSASIVTVNAGGITTGGLLVRGAADGVTPAPGDSSTQFATTAFITTAIDNAAPNSINNSNLQQLNSNFNISGNGIIGGNLQVNGTANGQTPATGDSSTQFATTAFVKSALDSFGIQQGTAVGNTMFWNGTTWVTNSNNIYNDGTNVAAQGGTAANSSIAMGQNTNASSNSFAVGTGTNASGQYSTAMGNGTTASGYTSTAMGTGNVASGTNSLAAGAQDTASGWGSFAAGSHNTASGSYAVATGFGNVASIDYSQASGVYSVASGAAGVAMGLRDTASGNYSTAMGVQTSTNGHEGSFIIGDYSGPAASTADNQFMGHFTGGYIFASDYNSTPANSMVYYNGDFGLGTLTPTAQLDASGTVRFENYINGILAVDPNGNLQVVNGGGLFTAGTGLSWNGNTLNSSWTISGNNIYNNNAAYVGIGTSSPTQFLDVSGGPVLVRNGGSSAATNSQLLMGYSGTPDYQHAIKTRHNANSAVGNDIEFYLWNYGTDAPGDIGTKQVMTLEGTGNVGIGTNGPTAQLHTTGTVRFQNYANGLLSVDANGYLGVATGSGLFTAGNGLNWSGTTLNSLWTASGNSIFNNNTANVGVGGNVPNTLFEVRKDNAGALGPVLAISNYGSGANTSGALDYYTYNYTTSSTAEARIASLDDGNYSAHLQFFTKAPGNPSFGLFERMRITSSGNIGIGTTTPTAQFHATGTVRFQNYTNGLLSVDANGNLGVSTGSGLFTAGSGLGWSGTTLNSVWNGTVNSGNLSYNGSQATMDLTDNYGGLHVEGKGGGEASIALQPDNVSNGSAGQWILYTNGSQLNSPNDFAIFNSSTGHPALNIQASSSNVGIGTTSPSVKLDVENGSTSPAFKLVDGTQAAGNVLTTDANGNASWTSPSTFGVTSVGPISGASTADGASITTGVLNLAPANATNGGVVTTGAQTFAGAKTFSSDAAIHGLTVGEGGGSAGSNTAVGANALGANTSGSSNTAVGSGSLSANTTAVANTGIGQGTLGNTTTGINNTATGYLALYTNTTASNNTADGYGALSAGTTGGNNTATGYQSSNFVTTGAGNTSIGYQALFTNTTGSHNTALGANADVSSANLSNATAVGYNAKAGASNTLILGNGANVGIGTSTPAVKLDVENGSTSPAFKLVDGTQQNNYVLKSDANGNASWALPSSLGMVGPTGIQGATGAQGVTGAVGATGAQGLQGVTGTQGLQGVQGTQGLQGVTGAQGIQGVTGTQGIQGITGAAGAAGAAGITGATGLLSSGSAAGNTPYWNGSAWVVNSSNIYNDGGNVGIGTANTAATLTVGDNTTTNAAIATSNATSVSTFTAGNFSNYNGGVLQSAYPGGLTGQIFNIAASGSNSGNWPSNIAFWTRNSGGTNATEKVRIDNAGNVGIGTSTPAVKLDVEAGSTSPAFKLVDGTQSAGRVLTSDASGNATWQAVSGTLGNGSAAGNTPYWNGSAWVVNSSNIYNDGGNVGINNTSPAHPLDVTGDINASTGYTVNGAATSGNYLRGNGTQFVSSAIQAGDIPAGSGNYIQNGTSQQAASNFNISANGVIGGTETVNGGSISMGNGISNMVKFANVGQGPPTFTTSSVGTKLLLYPDENSNTVDYAIGVAGNTLWNAVPAANNSYQISFYGGTTELMRVRGDGTVGIGTTTPGALLEVNGTGLFDGALTAGSTLQVNSTETVNGGSITMNNGTSNIVKFVSAGSGPPTFNTTSVGTKLVLLPDESSGTVDYGIGVAGATLWSAVPVANSSYQISFYGGTTELMRIRGDGNVGIGTTNPNATLEVNGTGLFDGALTAGSTLQVNSTETVNGGSISMNNGISNMVKFDNAGSGPPTFNTSSVGTKLVLSPDESSGTVDYGIGVAGATLWSAVPVANSSYQISFYGGTTELMRIRGDGSVGIGTTSPNATLEVNGTGLFDGALTAGTTLQVNSTETVNGGSISMNNGISNMIKFDNAGSGPPAFNTSSAGTKLVLSPDESSGTVDYGIGVAGATLWSAVPAANSSYQISFYGGTTELMRIRGDGNVGIGTTSPAHPLDVAGDVNSSTGYTIAGAATTGTYLRGNGTQFVSSAIQASDLPSNSGSYIQNSTSLQATSNFNISGNGYIGGNVGIGTTSPSYPLQIGSASSTYAQDAKIGFGTNSGGGNFRMWSVGSQYGGGNSSAPNYGFYIKDETGGTPRFNIDYNTGNVGLSNTTPNARLDINGSEMMNDGLTNASARPAVAGGTLANGEFRAYSSSGVAYDDGFMRLSAGAGTNANTKSYIDLSGYSLAADMNENIAFGTTGAERMRITSAGNVGIGTTAPAYTLDVNGSLRVTAINGSNDGPVYADNNGQLVKATTCPAGFTKYEVGLTRLCVLTNATADTWYNKESYCESQFGSSLCTYLQVAKACIQGLSSVTSGLWLADATGDNVKLYTNGTGCTDFEGTDTKTNTHGAYCCMEYVRF